MCNAVDDVVAILIAISASVSYAAVMLVLTLYTYSNACTTLVCDAVCVTDTQTPAQ
jgi:hypothetical protein